MKKERKIWVALTCIMVALLIFTGCPEDDGGKTGGTDAKLTGLAFQGITPPSISMTIDTTRTLTLVAVPSGANMGDITWSSSNEFFEVTPAANGLTAVVKALKVTTTPVKITATSSIDDIEASLDINITAAPLVEDIEFLGIVGGVKVETLGTDITLTVISPSALPGSDFGIITWTPENSADGEITITPEANGRSAVITATAATNIPVRVIATSDAGENVKAVVDIRFINDGTALDSNPRTSWEFSRSHVEAYMLDAGIDIGPNQNNLDTANATLNLGRGTTNLGVDLIAQRVDSHNIEFRKEQQTPAAPDPADYMGTMQVTGLNFGTGFARIEGLPAGMYRIEYVFTDSGGTNMHRVIGARVGTDGQMVRGLVRSSGTTRLTDFVDVTVEEGDTVYLQHGTSLPDGAAVAGNAIRIYKITIIPFTAPTPASLAGLSFKGRANGGSKEMEFGEAEGLILVPDPSNANMGTVEWTPLDNEFIEVIPSADGFSAIVKGVKATDSPVLVTAKSGSIEATFNYTVKAIPILEGLAIQAAVVVAPIDQLDVDEIRTLTLIPTPLAAPLGTITWSEGNEFLEVTPAGNTHSAVIKGLKVTTTPVTVTATAENNVTVSVSINVKAAPTLVATVNFDEPSPFGVAMLAANSTWTQGTGTAASAAFDFTVGGITFSSGGTGMGGNMGWNGADGGFITTGGTRTAIIRMPAPNHPVRIVVVYTNTGSNPATDARRPQVNGNSTGAAAPGPSNAAAAARTSFRWDLDGTAAINIGSASNSIRIYQVRVYNWGTGGGGDPVMPVDLTVTYDTTWDMWWVNQPDFDLIKDAVGGFIRVRFTNTASWDGGVTFDAGNAGDAKVNDGPDWKSIAIGGVNLAGRYADFRQADIVGGHAGGGNSFSINFNHFQDPVTGIELHYADCECASCD